MGILGIETSCDETAAAVVADGHRILSNVVASQVELHARYGGIVPEVASRQHLLSILPVLDQALREAGVSGPEVEAIAVTGGPGLAGSLLVGVNLAQALALAWGKPLVAVNHLEAHIYANWLEAEPPSFPLVCLIVSGGHTELLLMAGHGKYQALGSTRDDAAGEAFDKAARILGLGYPGGPAIEGAARQARRPYPFPRAWLRGSPDFSFSGLKTAALHGAAREGLLAGELHDLEALAPRRRPPQAGPPATAAELAAGFQEAVVEVLAVKTAQAAQKHGARLILLAGGVAANGRLREAITAAAPVPVRFPRPALCTDNAAMVAACGHYRLQGTPALQGAVDVRPNWRLV